MCPIPSVPSPGSFSILFSCSLPELLYIGILSMWLLYRSSSLCFTPAAPPLCCVPYEKCLFYLFSSFGSEVRMIPLNILFYMFLTRNSSSKVYILFLLFCTWSAFSIYPLPFLLLSIINWVSYSFLITIIPTRLYFLSSFAFSFHSQHSRLSLCLWTNL